MATTSYCEDSIVRTDFDEHNEQTDATSIWEEAIAWLALLPILFITVGGRIQTENAPVAFRFTAMEDDSIGRKLTRLACTVLILILVSTRLREILNVCKRSKLLLLLPAIALVSVLWSQNRAHTMVDALSLLVLTLFGMYLYVRYPGDRILSLLTFGAFISLWLCALTVIAFPSIGLDPFQENAWRGIFGQRNECAAICTLFLTLGLHYQTSGLMSQFIRGSVLLLSVIFIIMSGSRTGWILAALALILTYSLRFLSRLPSLDRILFLMVMSVPTIVLAFFIFNNFTQILAILDKDPTLTQRTVIWAQVIPSIILHPLLGYGYSGFWMGLSGASMQTVLVTGWMEGQAQDGYLDILLQLGIVGLIPLVMMFLRAAMHAVPIVERRMLNSISAFSIVLLPLVLVGNIGESTLLQPVGITWFYALIAFLVLARPYSDAEDF